MSKLENSIRDWVNHGFISRDQGKLILDYEEKKPESSWVLMGLLILGASVIGIGVISIIASNWRDIPDTVKLAVDFLLLSLLAFVSVRLRTLGKVIPFEVSLLSFMLLCLASIGLISQVFHTGGEFYQALLFWSVITTFAQWTSRHAFVPFNWFIAFLIGLAWAFCDSPSFEPIFHRNATAVYFLMPLIASGFAMLSRSLAGELAGSTVAYRAVTLVSILVGLVVTELSSQRFSVASASAYIPGYILLALVIVAILRNSGIRRLQKNLLFGVLFFFTISCSIPLEKSFLDAIPTIATLMSLAIFVASLQLRKLFQLLIVFVGIRFLIAYFQVFGDLAVTGIGLIISGIIVIGLAILWNKYRTRLAEWAEGVAR